MVETKTRREGRTKRKGGELELGHELVQDEREGRTKEKRTQDRAFLLSVSGSVFESRRVAKEAKEEVRSGSKRGGEEMERREGDGMDRTHDPVLSVDSCQFPRDILSSVWGRVIYDDDFEIQRAVERKRTSKRQRRREM